MVREFVMIRKRMDGNIKERLEMVGECEDESEVGVLVAVAVGIGVEAIVKYFLLKRFLFFIIFLIFKMIVF